MCIRGYLKRGKKIHSGFESMLSIKAGRVGWSRYFLRKSSLGDSTVITVKFLFILCLRYFYTFFFFRFYLLHSCINETGTQYGELKRDMQTLIHFHICIILFNERQGEYGVIARLIREYFLTFHFACCNMEYFPLLTCTKKFLLNMSNEVNQFLSDISMHFVIYFKYILTIIINIFKYISIQTFKFLYSSSFIVDHRIQKNHHIYIYIENSFRKCQVMVKIFIQFFFRNKGMEVNKYRQIN